MYSKFKLDLIGQMGEKLVGNWPIASQVLLRYQDIIGYYKNPVRDTLVDERDMTVEHFINKILYNIFTCWLFYTTLAMH